MGRPAKSVNQKAGAMTAEEIKIREESEKKLKGGSKALAPPSYLTKSQKDIFKYIVANLKDAEILGNLDQYILQYTAVTIDKMIEIDTELNQMGMTDPMNVSRMITARSNLSRDFFRCLNELSLSPQARAKISIANVKAIKEKKNSLLEALDL